jgi:2-octaprenylphenol hydroxylase
LGVVQRDIGSLRVLRRYERARRGDNVAMMLAMEGFKFLFSRKLPPLPWLRNVGLSLTDAATPIKEQIMRRAMGLSGERPRLARVPVTSRHRGTEDTENIPSAAR